MFITLLIVDLIIATLVCFIVAKVFQKHIKAILQRLISEDISLAWSKYVIFTIYVVGISGGVQVHNLEQYINPVKTDVAPPELTSERWVLEVYRCVINTLSSDAWLLLTFFIVVLFAYVIMKGFEMRRQGKT